MNVSRHHALASGIGLAALALACGPLRTAVPIGLQPSPSPEGVALSVARMSCREEVDLDANQVVAVVEARIDNRSAGIVVIRRDAFRLVARDGRAIAVSSFRVGSPVEVPAGASKILQLSFSTRGEVSCVEPLRLEAANAARQGLQSVYLPPVTFRTGPG